MERRISNFETELKYLSIVFIEANAHNYFYFTGAEDML